MKGFKKHLSIVGLLKIAHQEFKKIKDPRQKNSTVSSVNLVDCLMSGLALFGLKYPSLLQFEKDKEQEWRLRHNLRTLYRVERAPCDTHLRERLDEVEPTDLRRVFKKVFAKLQRGKVLEQYRYLNDYYLLSMDGTGHFSSEKVRCKHCCEKHHKDGRITYYHQMLGAAVVHPDIKKVIPLAPEAITQRDGNKKNDCERNASKRLLNHIRREHPHLKLIVIEDGLASNGPHLQELKRLDMRYIIGAKPGDHKYLFDWVNAVKCEAHEEWDEFGTKHQYRFINKVPLNDTNFDCEVNFLEYWEKKKDGKEQHFTWITDFSITKGNIYQIMKGGRARWKIENETFNTLKNQGYYFEHNFGHGFRGLCTVFSMLTLLAFLIDQAQALSCSFFKKVRERKGSDVSMWGSMRSLFQWFCWSNWAELFQRLMGDKTPVVLSPDTS